MTFREEIEIGAPCQAVWAAIHDYADRLRWDSMLRSLAVDGKSPELARPIDVGSEITQWAKWSAGGVRLTAKYTVYQPPTEFAPGEFAPGVAEIEMIDGPWFFDSFHAVSKLVPIDNRTTRCEAEYNYNCRPRFLLAAVEPAVRSFFERETRRRWVSLKSWLEMPEQKRRIVREPTAAPGH